MTNLRIDEMVLFRNYGKISTDENKAIYSINLFYVNTTFIEMKRAGPIEKGLIAFLT